MTSKYIDL